MDPVRRHTVRDPRQPSRLELHLVWIREQSPQLGRCCRGSTNQPTSLHDEKQAECPNGVHRQSHTRTTCNQSFPGSALAVIHIFLRPQRARPVGEGDGVAKRGNRENTDPHVLVTWVKRDPSAMWADRGSGSISFTIRTSRMGSASVWVSVAQPFHLVHHPHEADGVSSVVYNDERLRLGTVRLYRAM